MPDHPKEPVLYLLKGFINIGWNVPTIYLRALSLLGAYAQEKLAYHFSGGKCFALRINLEAAAYTF